MARDEITIDLPKPLVSVALKIDLPRLVGFRLKACAALCRIASWISGGIVEVAIAAE